ncbi:MAG: hypothetical protein AB1782_13070 [Cyanobacteriota bacterium]
MKNINEYIDKINQIAKKDENVKFMPITNEQIKEHVSNYDLDLEDYKEIKDMVKDLEKELSTGGKKVAPVVVPIKDRMKK